MMGDGGALGDQRPAWREGVANENERRSDFAGKLLWALFALLLITAVSVISYIAGRTSRDEPERSREYTLSDEPEAPPMQPATLPDYASPPPPEIEAAPPVARLLEYQSKTATAAPQQGPEKQSVKLAPGARQSPPVPQFRPARRVFAARRAIARRVPMQRQRMAHASKVVQLGEYPNRGQATAAYARLARAYPYLKTLPRTIKSSRPRTARSAYQLRVTAYSPEHARVLCQNLLSIGRGCAVLPEPG